MDDVWLLRDGHHLYVIFIWSALRWGGVVTRPRYVIYLDAGHHTPFTDLEMTRRKKITNHHYQKSAVQLSMWIVFIVYSQKTRILHGAILPILYCQHALSDNYRLRSEASDGYVFTGICLSNGGGGGEGSVMARLTPRRVDPPTRRVDPQEGRPPMKANPSPPPGRQRTSQCGQRIPKATVQRHL